MPPPIPVLVLDGGLGTTLTQAPHSLVFTPSTPLWSSHALITNPDAVRSAHRAFVEAGADVVLTATYQASFEGFACTRRVIRPYSRPGAGKEGGGHAEAKAATEGVGERADGHGVDGYGADEAVEFMRSSIPLALEAFDSSSRPPRVALSLGPYGATLSPSQEYSGIYPDPMNNFESLAGFHFERIRAFSKDAEGWNSVEWLAFETVKRVDEVQILRMMMNCLPKEGWLAPFPRDKKFWITAVFPDEVDDTHVTAMVNAMLASLCSVTAEPGKSDLCPRPWGIGINCTSVTKLPSIIAIMEREIPKFRVHPWLVLYPDGAVGLKYDTTKMEWVEVGELEGRQDGNGEKNKNGGGERRWAEQVCDVVKGVRRRAVWGGVLVGGCCKTDVNDIRELRERLDALDVEGVVDKGAL